MRKKNCPSESRQCRKKQKKTPLRCAVHSTEGRAKYTVLVLQTKTMAHNSTGSESTDKEEEEEMLCPLCLEELDITDRNFRPCQCGYQVDLRGS